ncbi:MAG: nucleoside deaminase [Blastocatellia bacterium]|nr:nucleoside deaminase [Blastocatellia bacterium]
MTAESHAVFMRRAIQLAQLGVDENRGGPFGCVIVKDDAIIGEGCNEVTSSNDPTAHAEIVAIRKACSELGSFQLEGCTVYTSCEPCPMCLGAIYWARPSAIFIAATREDAAAAGFDDEFFYAELGKPNEQRELMMKSLLREESQKIFASWIAKPDKIEY